ncbi:hypothetical protein HYU16_02940 [Candidatus Woesearchaeota archaeon]|nr:hypothetical protein [Candidatus Woesearchaeota archaeon]
MRKLVLGKRGAEATTVEVWFVVIGLILAALVTTGLLKKTVDDIKGKTLEKNYIARDIALALDAVYAAPGDVEYTYSLKKYKFVVEIKDSKVFVKDSLGEKDATAGIYDYFGDPDSKLSVRITPLPDDPRPMLVTLGNRNDVLLVKAENAFLEEDVAFT